MTFANPVNLRATLNLDDRFTPGLNNANRALGNFESGLGRVGRGAGQLGSGLARLATIGIGATVGGLTAATVAAISFEDAFAGIRKTVDEADLAAAGLTFEELALDIRAMAREMPIAAADLARIGEAAGALGIRAADIDEFIDVVARLSVTTDLTVDAASTALGQLGTILHLRGQDFEDFADTLVALGNAGASTESQIIEIANRFAAAGNAAGLSKEEILALSSAVASMGIEVEAGGTALSATFNNIATAIGTGSDEVNAFTETLGISADEFKRRFSQDALGTFTAFLRELSKLDQFEQARILTEAGITGARQLNAVKLMTQNLGFFTEQLEVATNATGALGEESQKRFATTASQLKILRNNLVDVGITIGSELLPVITDLTREFVDFLNEPGTQRGLQTFAQDLATGIRDIVREIRGMDFTPFINALGFMAEVGAKVVDLFRSLPPELQAIALTGLALNKLSGGLLGAGAGNIASGLIQVVFQRGTTPANPLWVASVGGVGGVGGAGGTTGIATLLRGILSVTLFTGIATAIGGFLAENVTRPLNPQQFDFLGAAMASGNFPSGSQLGVPAAKAFAEDLAEELDLPLKFVQQSIVNAINIRGRTFDQAVAELRGDVTTSVSELTDEEIQTRREIGAGFTRNYETLNTMSQEEIEGRAEAQRLMTQARLDAAQSAAFLGNLTRAGTSATTTRLSVLEGLDRVNNATANSILRKPIDGPATVNWLALIFEGISNLAKIGGRPISGAGEGVIGGIGGVRPVTVNTTVNTTTTVSASQVQTQTSLYDTLHWGGVREG